LFLLFGRQVAEGDGNLRLVLLPDLTLMPLTSFGDRNESTSPVRRMRLPPNKAIVLKRFD
jgi:hypothetical protein